MPKDVADRDAETARVDGDGDSQTHPDEGGGLAEPVDEDEVMEESDVVARRAPREPTEAGAPSGGHGCRPWPLPYDG